MCDVHKYIYMHVQNGGLSERGEDGRTSSSWNGGTSDADHESVLSMTMESEASNVAVKVTRPSA